MNTPVSFEIAKLLKEKGFDKSLDTIFNTVYDIEDMSLMKNVHQETLTKGKELFLHAPTIAEVVMWLYKEKGLWVNVMYMGFELKYSWSIDIITTSGSDWDSYGEEGDICYKSPTEAYSQAIEYTLKNLI